MDRIPPVHCAYHAWCAGVFILLCHYVNKTMRPHKNVNIGLDVHSCVAYKRDRADRLSLLFA